MKRLASGQHVGLQTADCCTWCSADTCGCAGMNSGVLLMRNTDWMRDLFGQMAHYGTHPMNLTREEVCILEDITPVCKHTSIKFCPTFW